MHLVNREHKPCTFAGAAHSPHTEGEEKWAAVFLDYAML